MRVENIGGKDYRLPGGLNDFQLRMYVHLINWKWKHITAEPGYYEHEGRQIPYDAILPAKLIDDLRVVHPSVVEELRRHRGKNRFRLHNHFNHMASSQAANVNLFLPILQHRHGSKILARVNGDVASLATDHLDHGYCLEFWGGNFGGYDESDRGPLGDKSARRGTDSDIAIAYRNSAGELCLWLIEHKLTEKEFTPCSGPKSKDRDKARHRCTSTFAETLQNKHTCFHHDYGKRKYWDITESNRTLFVNHAKHAECPFQGGMNQLWRNQLLALAMEQSEEQPYKHAAFSVVKHPANEHLNASLSAFADLVDHSPKFSVFTSADVLQAAEALQDDALTEWAKWYRALYMV
jgi:hypothetical protein